MNILRLLLTLVAIICFQNLSSQEYKTVGYFAGWAIYSPQPCAPNQLDPTLLTHLNYAFTKVDTQGNIQLVDPWADIQIGQDWNDSKTAYWGNFRQLNQLKAKYPHLKTLVSIGGWTLSDTFSILAENPASRTRFAESIVAFCKRYGFDGADIDWEYPGFDAHSGRPQDKEHFTLMLAEIHRHAKAQNPPLLVTIAAPAGPHHYEKMEVANIHPYLDWINLMTYDFHGPWGGGEDAVTNHLAPLYAPKQGNPLFCGSAAVQYYLEQGVRAEKIILGLPFYGRSYGQVGRGNSNGLFSSYSGPGRGTHPQEPGMMAYYDIKKLFNTYSQGWDEQAQVPYLYNPHTKEFISFDNETSLRSKCDYIKRMGLGGAMIWELSLDSKSWELLRVVHHEMSN